MTKATVLHMVRDIRQKLSKCMTNHCPDKKIKHPGCKVFENSFDRTVATARQSPGELFLVSM